LPSLGSRNTGGRERKERNTKAVRKRGGEGRTERERERKIYI